MKFVFALFVSFALSVPAYAAWPAQVRQGALVSCELEKTSEFIMKLGPLQTETANQKALKLCTCLVEKAEQKNSRPPQSEAEMKQRLASVAGVCTDGGAQSDVYEMKCPGSGEVKRMRFQDAATARRFGPIMGQYECSGAPRREQFYGCVRASVAKRREQLKLGPAARISNDEAEKIQRGCMKQFPPSK